MGLEIQTDARLKPEATPAPSKEDQILAELATMNRQLHDLFWACGGPMAVQANMSLYMHYHPEVRPEKPRIVTP